GSLMDQANEMKNVDLLRAERTAIAGMEARGRGLFGDLWQGERSGWNALDQYVRWVVEFRGLCVRYNLGRRTINLASTAAPDVSDIDRLNEAGKETLAKLAQLHEAAGWPASYLSRSPFVEIVKRAEELSANIKRGPQWAAFEAPRQTVEA